MQGLRRWLAATLAVGISGVLQLPIALADERTDARREFRAGMQSIADGRYDEGIAHLESAYDTLPHPNVLYNIGLAHMYAGRADEAISYFERYKETAPPSDAAEVDVLIGNLRGKSEAVAAAESAAQQAAEKGDIAGSIEAAAREVRRMAEETGNEALRKQAEGLEATAKTMRGEKPAEATTETTVAKPEAPKPAEVAADQKQEGVYEEEVVSASRFAQSPLDAPNATAIITAQDIRMTGLLTLTDLLRRVVGMEVTAVTPNHAEISIRGLNKRQSNKVLFLIDGRSHRLDFLGTSWINQQPVALEDIERIEVIKGPASALYGADAFSGIINVITRAPGEGRSYVAGQYGSNNTGRGVMSFTGRSSPKVAYRMSANYFQTDNAVVPVGPDRIDVEPFTSTPNVARKGAAVDGQLRFDLAKETQLTVGGNALYGDNTVAGQSRLGQVTSHDSWEGNVYETLILPKGFKLAGWYDHISGNSGPSYITPGSVELIGSGLKQDIADADLSWSGRFKLLVPQNLTIGGGYRFKSIKWAWLDGNHTQHHAGAYIQDVLELAKPLTLQIGARVDHHPLLSSVQFSPRGSLVYRFLEQQSLRLSIGRAFRGPSFLESYVQVPNGADLRGVEGYGKGNDGLNPESIVSYELGYQNQASDYFALEANVYFNTVKNLILFTDIDRYTLQQYGQPGLAAYDPAQQAFAANQIAYTNEAAVYRQLGAELGARFYPVAGLDIYGNYSIHDTSPFDDSKVTDPARLKEQQTSTHKVNAGVQWRARFGLDLAADVAWTSSQVWVEQVSDPEQGVRFQAFHVDPFTWVNARIGYRLFNDQLELGLVGTNLAFQDKRQHPYGQPLDTRVYGSAKLRF